MVVQPQREAAKPPPKPVSVAAIEVEDVVVLQQQPSATPTPKPEPKSGKLVKKKTEQLEAARAQMAAQLAEVAAKAADSDAAKRDERKEKTDRVARTATAKPASGGSVRTVAVLSGEGERRHQETRLWWLWLGLAAVIVLLLLFVFNLSSSTRSTVESYAAPVPAEQNRYPVLGEAVRARAWLTAAHSMVNGPVLATDLSDAVFGDEHAIDLAPLAPKLAELKGMRLDATLGVWLVPGDLEKARSAVGARTAEAAKLLSAARIRHVVHAQAVESWGLAEPDRTVLLDLLTGTPPREGEPIGKRMLDQGELPDRIVLRPFHGRSGSLLIDNGRPPYRQVQGPYAGIILRFEGSRWPIGWKVLHLDQAK